MDNLGLSSPGPAINGALALDAVLSRSTTKSCHSFEGLCDSVVNLQPIRKCK